MAAKALEQLDLESAVNDLGEPDLPGREGGRVGKSSAAFRTISEVATDLDVAQHVLRFWESKFPQVKPLKRGGGRRYYRPEDVELLRDIRQLLYQEGYTIKGAQKLLRQRRSKATATRMASARQTATAKTASEPVQTEIPADAVTEVESDEPETGQLAKLQQLRDELAQMRSLLNEAASA